MQRGNEKKLTRIKCHIQAVNTFGCQLVPISDAFKGFLLTTTDIKKTAYIYFEYETNKKNVNEINKCHCGDGKILEIKNSWF